MGVNSITEQIVNLPTQKMLDARAPYLLRLNNFSIVKVACNYQEDSNYSDLLIARTYHNEKKKK